MIEYAEYQGELYGTRCTRACPELILCLCKVLLYGSAISESHSPDTNSFQTVFDAMQQQRVCVLDVLPKVHSRVHNTIATATACSLSCVASRNVADPCSRSKRCGWGASSRSLSWSAPLLSRACAPHEQQCEFSLSRNSSRAFYPTWFMCWTLLLF